MFPNVNNKGFAPVRAQEKFFLSKSSFSRLNLLDFKIVSKNINYLPPTLSPTLLTLSPTYLPFPPPMLPPSPTYSTPTPTCPTPTPTLCTLSPTFGKI